ncbi:hypothetical protein [uncultured Treponema sp.]|uniref:hypothetical protein n=1 Tax=uncultured Treponema sp. TaxID=162155 RepID=UPI0025DFFD39|nr:hypothetical protein [uncultured Treponema sp.]
MKKIVSAAAAALILGGFAAAEATFSVNYRTGIEVLSHQMKHNTHLLNGVTANRTTSDALSFKGKADFGGLELEITPTYSNDGNEGTLSLAKYNGWINFGKFSFKSGAWDSRAVGRVNADIGNHEGKFWGELQKPGLANKLGTSGNGVDISQQNGKKKITNMISYTNKDMGLEARGAFIESKAGTYANPDDAGDDWVFDNDQWFAEIGYTIKDVGRILFTTKDSHKDMSFALFVEPKLADLKALTSLVGVTYEQNTSGEKTQTAIAIDARARYAIDDQLSVTAMYNWTGGDVGTTETKTAKYATWGMLNATYKLNETFVPFCSMIYSSGAAAGAVGALGFKDTYAASLRVYPGVEIYNTKSANLITGLVVDLVNFTGEDDDFTKKFTIPVLMRVKF